MTNPHKGRTGFDRLLHAADNSLAGLRSAYREESAFRQEVWLTLVLVPLAWWWGDTPLERALLISAVVLVLVVELLNSGIEAAIDRISFEEHPLAKRAKDYGSAAVMLALLLCATLWLGVGWRRMGW